MKVFRPYNLVLRRKPIGANVFLSLQALHTWIRPMQHAQILSLVFVWTTEAQSDFGS